MEEKIAEVGAEGTDEQVEPQGPVTGVGAFEFDAGDGRKSSYVGEWAIVNGTRVRQGHGTYQFSDSQESYEGQWLGDEMNGKGRYCFATGAIYDGTFHGNKLSGFGKYSWVDGAMYEGEWSNNRMHGRGIYTTKEGVRWEGDFLNGKFLDGRGTYVDVRTTTPTAEDVPQDCSTEDAQCSTKLVEESKLMEESKEFEEEEKNSEMITNSTSTKIEDTEKGVRNAARSEEKVAT